MKNALKILATALVAMLFASCSQQAIYHGGSGSAVKTTPTYVASGSSKEVAAPQTYAAPVVEKKVKKDCRKCGSYFCPKPGCCGVVSKKVLSRATAQGGSGEPHIGLIPTMKTLAP